MREAGSIDARPSHPSPACISVHSFHHDEDDGDDDDDDEDDGDDDDDNDDHTCQDEPQQSVKWSGSPGLGQLKEVSTSSAKMFVVFIQHR